MKQYHFTGRVTHNARCDACGKQIVGARYKCLHPSCPDYDLCEDCEALPIDVHPSSHVMVKAKQLVHTYEGLQKVFKLAHQKEEQAPVPPEIIRIRSPVQHQKEEPARQTFFVNNPPSPPFCGVQPALTGPPITYRYPGGFTTHTGPDEEALGQPTIIHVGSPIRMQMTGVPVVNQGQSSAGSVLFACAPAPPIQVASIASQPTNASESLVDVTVPKVVLPTLEPLNCNLPVLPPQQVLSPPQQPIIIQQPAALPPPSMIPTAVLHI